MDLMKEAVIEVFPSNSWLNVSPHVRNVKSCTFVHILKVEARGARWVTTRHRVIIWVLETVVGSLTCVSEDLKFSSITLRYVLALVVLECLHYVLPNKRVDWWRVLSDSTRQRLSYFELPDWRVFPIQCTRTSTCGLFKFWVVLPHASF